MNIEVKDFLGLILAAILTGLLIGYLFGYCMSAQYYKKSAVKAGVGEWVIINESGDTNFVWVVKE